MIAISINRGQLDRPAGLRMKIKGRLKVKVCRMRLGAAPADSPA
jgi:hypothetical protein